MRKKVLWATVAVVVVGVVAAAVVLGPRLRSPEQAAADAAPPPASLVTAVAERRVLAEPVVLRGEVRPGAGVRLVAPSSALGEASVVTDVLVATGDLVEEGQAVIVRSGEPMFALVLPFPLYRDLVGGMKGPDVVEVQRALGRLGYGVGEGGVLDAATQRAIGRFHTDRGFPAPAGTPDSVRAVQPARQAVAAAQLAHDATPTPATKAQLDQAKAVLRDAESAAGPGLARSAVLRLDRPGRRISSIGVQVGSVLTGGAAAEAGPDTPPSSPAPQAFLLELDGEPPFVVAFTDKDRVGLLKVGGTATLSDDASGSKAPLSITSVADHPSDSGSGQPGFEVRFAFSGTPMDVAVERSVRIDIAAADDFTEVLAVPVSAVYSRADGKTFVTVANGDSATADVDVETGRIAGGWVEITFARSEELAAGVPVVVGGDSR